MVPGAENGAPLEGTQNAGEAEAWALVERAWDDEERHRAYLATFGDLEGLAIAGGRYRAVLEARPNDALALRFRDEILHRATALLAAAPRDDAPAGRAGRVFRIAAIALTAALGFAAALAAWRLFSIAGERP